MDLLTVDLTDHDNAKIGDNVTLWGNGLPIELISEYSGQITNSILTRLSARVPRILF